MSVLQSLVCVELRASARTHQAALAVNASKDSVWTPQASTVEVMYLHMCVVPRDQMLSKYLLHSPLMFRCIKDPSRLFLGECSVSIDIEKSANYTTFAEHSNTFC